MANLRLGIIGTGGISRGHIERLSALNGVTITAICDIKPDHMQRTVDRFSILADARRFEDHKELLGAGITDGVVICTPHTTHFDQIMNSLSAGQHVLSEKPLVCTVKDAHQVLDAEKKSGKVLVLNYQRHYQPEFLYIRDAIASGKYGPVQFVQGLQGQEWLKNCANSWRHDPALSGGGQLNDSGSHMLAVLLFVTGLAVASVGAFIDNMTVPVDINSALSIKFVGGAQGNVSVVGNATRFHEDITIWCDRGIFFMRNGSLEVADEHGKLFKPAPEDLPAGSNPDVNFVNAILHNEPIGSPAIWGLRVIELTEAAWKSADTGAIATV